MLDRFQLSDIADETIEHLEADGVELSAQDILTIQRLSLAAQGDINIDDGRPVCLSGVWLRPLTIAGEMWLQDFEEAFPKDGRKQRLAIAYALSHGSRPFVTFGKESWPEVRAFAKQLDCSSAQLEAAILETLGDNVNAPEESEEEKKGNIENLVLMCCALVGGEPDTWRYQLSIPQLQKLILARVAFNTADGKQSKGDEKLIALRELGKFEKALREKAKANGKRD